MHAEELKNLVARFNASDESKKETKTEAGSGSVLTIGGRKKEKEENRREEAGIRKEELSKKEDLNVKSKKSNFKILNAFFYNFFFYIFLIFFQKNLRCN